MCALFGRSSLPIDSVFAENSTESYKRKLLKIENCKKSKKKYLLDFNKSEIESAERWKR